MKKHQPKSFIITLNRHQLRCPIVYKSFSMLTYTFFSWHIVDPQQTVINLTQVHKPRLQ